MPLIEWTDEYSVGIPMIDEQHQQLVVIINRFEDARRQAKASRVVSQILNEILGYTQEHFAFEEKMLKKAGYADLAAHQSQHRQLLQKIERLQYEYNNEGRRITAEMGELFKYWVTSHILQHDQGYAGCLQTLPVES